MSEEGSKDRGRARAFRAAAEEAPERAAALAARAHPADVVAWLADLEEEAARAVFARLARRQRAAVLEYADEELRERLVAELSAAELAGILADLPADEAVDVLRSASEPVSEQALGALASGRAAELRALRRWREQSVGSLMTTDYVALPRGTSVAEAIRRVQASTGLDEGVGVFVLDEGQRPIGFLAEHELLTHAGETPLEEVMVAPITLLADEHEEAAAQLVAKYGPTAAAVVDRVGRLVGVLAPDDLQEVYERAVQEDILRIAGTMPAFQPTRLSILRRVRRRLPVMLVTVAGGLVTARVLDYFLARSGRPEGGTAAVLRYLPIVIGLAGNVGIQSSTILVRAFATGEVEPEREGAVLVAEVTVGLLLGLTCGSATALVSSWLEHGSAWLGATHPFAFGSVLGLAVALAVTWAALLGCLIPMACRRIGFDPATVAGPFLISLSDVSGSAIYVAAATSALARLLG